MLQHLGGGAIKSTEDDVYMHVRIEEPPRK